MAKSVTAIIWRGLDAWQFETDLLRIVVVPALGAKLVSLFDKKAGREWLAPTAVPPRGRIPYAASFLEYSLGGWDEMLPTIIACDYPSPGEFQGARLPDHGEVWSLEWEVTCTESEALTCCVDGVALPYRLTRRLELVGEAAFLLDYHLEHRAGEELCYLWAAHPLFVADASLQIVIPEQVTEVVNVQVSDTWGEAGRRYAWPRAQTQDGMQWSLDRVGPPSRQASRKFYLPPEKPVGWAALSHGESSSGLHLAWRPAQLPYLGIWVDEGCYTIPSTVALEPSSGYYDDLSLAWRNGRLPALGPGSSADWQLTVTLYTNLDEFRPCYEEGHDETS